MKKMIKIFEPTPDGACSFYRSIGPLSKLNKIDSNYNIEVLQNVNWITLQNTDILFLERPHSPNFVEAIEIAKSYNIPIVIDMDDDLLNIPTYNPAHKFFSKPKIQECIVKSIKLADVVLTSTQLLKDKFSAYNNNVHIVENALNDYNLPLKKVSGLYKTILWRGSNTHRQDLLCCSDSMFSIAKKHEDEWSWVFIGGREDGDLWYITENIKNNFNLKECDLLTYHNFIRDLKASIQIVPLMDNQFNKSKSNIAWIEGTLSGSATLAPDFPEFRKPGVTLYNPENPDSFGYQLEKLMKNDKKREENYIESLNYVKENLLLSTINKKRIEIFDKLLKK